MVREISGSETSLCLHHCSGSLLKESKTLDIGAEISIPS